MSKSNLSRTYVRIFKELKSLCDLGLDEIKQHQFDEDSQRYCEKILSEIASKLKHEQQRCLKPTSQILDQNTFDASFSSEFFTFDKTCKKATWLKPSTNNFYSDYNYYPVVRLNKIITDVRTIKIKMPSYGWLGVGSQNVKSDGFPGYTTEGWMLCTDGRLFHNKNCIKSYPLKLSDMDITVKVDAKNGQMEVNSVKIELGSNLPKALYFIISVREQTVQIVD